MEAEMGRRDFPRFITDIKTYEQLIGALIQMVGEDLYINLAPPGSSQIVTKVVSYDPDKEKFTLEIFDILGASISHLGPVIGLKEIGETFYLYGNQIYRQGGWE